MELIEEGMPTSETGSGDPLIEPDEATDWLAERDEDEAEEEGDEPDEDAEEEEEETEDDESEDDSDCKR